MPTKVKAGTARRFCLFGFACAYCGTTSEHLYRDHVIPSSRGGPDMPENIVPACLRCNSSKGAKPVLDWYYTQPFFSRHRFARLQRWCPFVDQLLDGAGIEEVAW